MMNSPGSDKPAIITTAPQAKHSEILMWLKEDLSDHCHMPHYTADTTATWTQGGMTHQKRRKGRMLPSVTFPNSSREAQQFRWGTFTRIDLQEMTLGCIPVRLPCSSFFPGHLAASPAARGAAVPLPGRSQSHTQSIRQHTSTGSNPRCISLDDFPYQIRNPAELITGMFALQVYYVQGLLGRSHFLLSGRKTSYLDVHCKGCSAHTKSTQR